jgi:hypothetical protein
MSDDVTSKDPGLSRGTRRALLLAGGTAAIGAVAAAAASPAEASNGKAVILGAANTASLGTVINATAPSGGAITVHNKGKAHGSWFTSTLGNGFIGGTYSANAQGANVANYATTSGTGAALVASGGANTGVYAVSAGVQRFAGKFVSGAATGTVGKTGAIFADGGIADGIFAGTSGDPNNFSAVTAYHINGGSGVYGWGFSGVQGDSPLDSGAGVFARAIGDAGNTVQPVALIAEADAPAMVAIQATGEVHITGDLFVDGTIHTNHAVDTAWTPPAAALKVRKRAARAAVKARASLEG